MSFLKPNVVYSINFTGLVKNVLEEQGNVVYHHQNQVEKVQIVMIMNKSI